MTWDSRDKVKLFMSIKIDLEKAYDRLSLDFIRDTLVTARFPSNLSAVREGIWRSIQAGRHGSPISHLMFADDLLLFSEASMEQVQVIKNVLDAFCAALGQKANSAKSLLFFSRNVPPDLNFIWGHLADQRKLHLKYVRRVDEGLKLNIFSSDSWLWKAIARAWNQVSEGATWAVSRGDRARFWEDSWIPNCRPLLDLSRREVPADLRGRPVADFVDVNGSWNWNVISDWLDHSSMLKVAAVVPPKASMETDLLFWSKDASGSFSVSYAYLLLCPMCAPKFRLVGVRMRAPKCNAAWECPPSQGGVTDAREKKSPLLVYDPMVEGRQVGLLGSGPNWAGGLDWADGGELGRTEPNWTSIGLGRWRRIGPRCWVRAELLDAHGLGR
ncbi:hypothetical protein CRG98_032764 [Punica granatum]|uniref:Reverse transcriptase domain-containing protein n=1 Tax=Punica granatum TaxID=22663 RepID=A0A2I0ITT5_PUNGR|nr:hypothetical protein CRG98_032764 [Punica granatum]